MVLRGQETRFSFKLHFGSELGSVEGGSVVPPEPAAYPAQVASIV